MNNADYSTLLSQFGDRLRQLRTAAGLSQEAFAAKAGFSRSYYTEIETGKRNVSLLNLVRIADALGVGLRELFDFQATPVRQIDRNWFIDAPGSAGLTVDMIYQSMAYTYQLVDTIDHTLLAAGASRIAETIELTNLSSMLGNLLGAGVAQNSTGVFERNAPHRYPDLLARTASAADIEIKVALETNQPKGHLAKSGYYLIYRYVLTDSIGQFVSGKANRGDVVHFWEVRFGWLDVGDFSLSSTPGDSGKTATIGAKVLKNLNVIYCDLGRCPYSPKSQNYKALERLFR